ncbi:aconitase X [Lutispora sp.]|uniref:aconitase X n=1 Tax=Lutispora sp. TaxID=2828727 RepID=UPI00356ABAA5
MVKLTEYEQRMLNGEMGEFKQKALQFIVKYAEVLGANELCKISRATVFIGAQHYLDSLSTDNYDEIFSKFYLNSEKEIKVGEFAKDCICQTCAAPCDINDYETVHLSKEFFEKNKRFMEITKEAGVSIVNSCTPYYVGWLPLKGEHFVTTESSNVVMSNSLFGACGNADGIEAAVCAAICGRTPLWGYHVKENRYGTVVFNIKCPSESVYDWDIIGYTMGRLLPPHGKPIINGNFEIPNINKLRQCFSSLSTTSGAEICHVVGFTPEARTLEDALGGKKPIEVIDITYKDYEESVKMICDEGSGDIDLVSIGCPHLALDEIKEIAMYLKGKKIKENVELWIWTDYAIQAMADFNGYTDIIKESGAKLLNSSCPIVMREESHKHSKGMVMNGAKQAHGIKSQTKVPVYFGDIFKCIDAAIKGRWEA